MRSGREMNEKWERNELGTKWVRTEGREEQGEVWWARKLRNLKKKFPDEDRIDVYGQG
jgi:hypothetical protein